MNKRIAVLSLASVVVISAVTAALWRGSPAMIAGKTETTPSPARLISAGCRFQPAQQAAFRVSSTVSAAGQSDRFSGLMNWQVDEVSDHSARIRAVFTDVYFTQEMTLPEERATSPEGLPFYLEVGSDCHILQRGFATAWQPASRMVISTLLDNFAFSLPLAAVSHWQTENTDGLGNYAAEFVLKSEDPLTIQRHKLVHEVRGQADTFGIKISLQQATAQATFSTATPLWWQTVTGQEQIRMKIPGQPEVTLDQHFTLQRDDARFAGVPALAWSQADFSDPYDVTVEAAALTNTQPSYDAARESLAAAVHDNPPRYYDGARTLAAWLKEHPQDVALVVAELLGGLPAAMRPTAFFALQLSGTEEARTALAELMNEDALSAADRARAASALADIGTPSRATADLLLQRAESADMAGNVSLLGVGSMMSRTRDEELRRHLIESLQQRNSITAGRADELLVLDAMGNSGEAAFADTLTEKLGTGSAAVRRHAALALAKLPPEQASTALLEQLSVEDDPRVTTTLVKALTITGAGMDAVLPALDQRLTRAGDNQRAAIVELLGQQNTDAARQLLAQQFKREKNARIQQRIGRYLPAERLR